MTKLCPLTASKSSHLQTAVAHSLPFLCPFLIPAGWHADVKAGAGAATLNHDVTMGMMATMFHYRTPCQDSLWISLVEITSLGLLPARVMQVANTRQPSLNFLAL